MRGVFMNREACVVSWPGKYATAWDHLVETARGGQTSAAVLVLFFMGLDRRVHASQ